MYEGRIDSDLVFAVEKKRGVESVAISLWVSVGSRFESEDQAGMAHFLEHMAFKGTSQRSALEIAKFFDGIGGYLNACTSGEYTVYFAKVLKRDFEEALEILCSIITDPLLLNEEIAKERLVVLQEIARANDDPESLLYSNWMASAYKNQPLGRPILGFEKTVSDMTQDSFKNFVRTHYTADRIFPVIVGDVDEKRVEELLNLHLSGKFPCSKNEGILQASYNGGSCFHKRELDQLHFILGFPGAPLEDDLFYATKVLCTILGEGMSSRLFQEIREKRGLAYFVRSFLDSYTDTALFGVAAGVERNSLEKAIKVVASELKGIPSSISAQELSLAKARILSSFLIKQDSVLAQSSNIGHNYALLGRNISQKELLDKLNAVTISDVQEVVNRLTSKGKLVFSVIGDLGKVPDYATLCDMFGM